MNAHELDQSEVLVRLQTLELSARFLRSAVEASTGEKVEAPSLPEGDLVASLNLLQSHCALLQNKLENFQPRGLPGGKSAPSGVRCSNAAVSLPDQSAQITALTQERDVLKVETERLRSEKAKLQSDMDGLSVKYARELAFKLAEFGVNHPNPRARFAATGKPLTATEKVLAAKGVNSLAELEGANKPPTQ
jgi:hypothetical protein